MTIVSQKRVCLFGDVINGEMQLNVAGQMLADEWLALLVRFPHIELDEWIVMPNHFHGLIVISETSVGATLVVAPNEPNQGKAGTPMGTLRVRPAATNQPALGDIVGAFKSITTDNYIHGVREMNWPPFNKKLWQRNYYEHIVRNESDLNAVRKYIANNPLSWALDRENPGNKLPLSLQDDYSRDLDSV